MAHGFDTSLGLVPGSECVWFCVCARMHIERWPCHTCTRFCVLTATHIFENTRSVKWVVVHTCFFFPFMEVRLEE